VVREATGDTSNLLPSRSIEMLQTVRWHLPGCFDGRWLDVGVSPPMCHNQAQPTPPPISPIVYNYCSATCRYTLSLPSGATSTALFTSRIRVNPPGTNKNGTGWKKWSSPRRTVLRMDQDSSVTTSGRSGLRWYPAPPVQLSSLGCISRTERNTRMETSRIRSRTCSEFGQLPSTRVDQRERIYHRRVSASLMLFSSS
jgi:hypothetical protein